MYKITCICNVQYGHVITHKYRKIYTDNKIIIIISYIVCMHVLTIACTIANLLIKKYVSSYNNYFLTVIRDNL